MAENNTYLCRHERPDLLLCGRSARLLSVSWHLKQMLGDSAIGAPRLAPFGKRKNADCPEWMEIPRPWRRVSPPGTGVNLAQ